MSTDLKVGVAQLNSTDDWQNNWEQVEFFLNQAKGLDLVCFPENALYFRIYGPMISEVFSLTHQVYKNIQSWVDKNQTAVLLGGTPIKQNNDLYNASLWFEPGKDMSIAYKKIHLFDVSLENVKIEESAYFTRGIEPKVLNYKGWKFGLSICYDIRFPELYREYFHQDVDAVFIPSAFTVPTGEAHWETLNKARAIENQFYVLSAAQGGTHQGSQTEKYRSTYGHSMVVDPWGQKIVEAKGQAPEFLVCELSKDRLSYVREQMPVKEHVRLR